MSDSRKLTRKLDPNKGWFIILLAALTAQSAIAIDVLLPAMPRMMEGLDMSSSKIQMIIGGFIGGFAIGQFFWGWLSDWLGRRPMILIGSVGYTVITLLCAGVENGDELIILRVILGVFASASVTIARAILRDHFSGIILARKVSLMTAIFFLTPMFAPQLGTVLLVFFGWRSVFWVPGVVSCICLIVAWVSLGESLPKSRRRRSSFKDIFVLIKDMFTHPMSGLCIGIHACMSLGLLVWISSSSLVLTGYFSVPEVYFGFLFTIGAVFQLIGSLASSWMLQKYSPSFLIGLGSMFCAVGGIVVFCVTVLMSGSLWPMMVGVWIYLLGFGLIVPVSGGMAVHAFGAAGGIAAALMGSIQSLSGSAGSAFAAYIYDDTSFSLGLNVGLSALGASIFGILLSRKLFKHPELLEHPEEIEMDEIAPV